jgi:Ca2+-binding RTX toxin-like protein
VDTITDFKGDEIYLYSNPFTNHNFISVTLLSDAHSGEGIIYEKSTGTLYYDNDGAGSGEAGTAFAILTGKPTILLTNFVF